MTRRNTGKGSEAIFDGIMARYGKRCFVYKVTDTASVKSAVKGGFVKAQPSDRIVTLDGHMFYAEIKSTTSHTRIATSCLRPSQRNAAVRQRAAGGDYFIFVHALHLNEWFKIPGHLFTEAEQASFTWDELAEHIWRPFP